MIRHKKSNFNSRPLYKLITQKTQKLCFSAKGLSSRQLILRSSFSMIKKKSTLEYVFEFFYSDPQLDQNLKPQEICAENFYIHIYVYLCLMFNIS